MHICKFISCFIQFTVRASDQQPMEKHADVAVSVVVSRDQQPPRFSNTPYTATVSENLNVDQSVMRVYATDNDVQVC